LPDSGEVIVTGKGNKQRVVPVGQAALDALRAWLAVRPAPSDGSNALFLSTRGSRISPRVLQQRLQAQGWRRACPCMYTRTCCATRSPPTCCNPRATACRAGNARPYQHQLDQVYTALDFQHLAEVYDQAHPRAKVK
jgi:integrase/recombinase XerC